MKLVGYKIGAVTYLVTPDRLAAAGGDVEKAAKAQKAEKEPQPEEEPKAKSKKKESETQMPELQ